MLQMSTLLFRYSGNLKVANSFDTKFLSSCFAWQYGFPLSSKSQILMTPSPTVQGLLFVRWKVKYAGHFKVTLAPELYWEVHVTYSSKTCFPVVKKFEYLTFMDSNFFPKFLTHDYTQFIYKPSSTTSPTKTFAIPAIAMTTLGGIEVPPVTLCISCKKKQNIPFMLPLTK